MPDRLILGFSLVACVLLTGGCEPAVSDRDVVLISLPEVRELLARQDAGDDRAVLLIDPRAPKYFDAGHLPGAINLRLHQAREDAPRDPALAGRSRLVVYGRNPGSAVAKAMFKRMLAIGYSGLRFYPGGVEEWVERGYELEASPTAEDPELD